MSRILKYGLVVVLVSGVVLIILWKPGGRNDPSAAEAPKGAAKPEDRLQNVVLKNASPLVGGSERDAAALEADSRRAPDLSLALQGTVDTQGGAGTRDAAPLDSEPDSASRATGGALPEAGPIANEQATAHGSGEGLAEEPPSQRDHIVTAGDTLSSLARAYLGSAKRWREILDANPGLDAQRLAVGMKVVLPQDGGLARSQASTAAGGAPATNTRHVVAAGESLYSLAKKYYGNGNDWRRIQDANPGLSNWQVKAGVELVIPPPGSGR